MPGGRGAAVLSAITPSRCLVSKLASKLSCTLSPTLVYRAVCPRSQAGLPFASKEESGAAAAEIARFCIKQRYRPGDVLWQEGQPSDELFIVEQGRIMVQQRVQQPGGGSLPEAAGALEEEAAVAQQQQQQQQQGAVGPAMQQHQHQQQRAVDRVRLFEFGPGCIAGAVDFYLGRWATQQRVCCLC